MAFFTVSTLGWLSVWLEAISAFMRSATFNASGRISAVFSRVIVSLALGALGDFLSFVWTLYFDSRVAKVFEVKYLFDL